ncbi:PAS domain S-box protein [Methanohalophilus sp. RSK]|nr:PAS domain S-box protein [Methanohalophilus sp. RSK]
MTDAGNINNLLLLKKIVYDMGKYNYNFEKAVLSILENILIFDDIDAAGIYTVNNENENLELVTYSGSVSSEFVSFVRTIGKDFPLRKKLNWGVNTYLNYRDSKWQPQFTSEGLKAVGNLPILNDDKLIASLIVVSKKCPHITEQTREFMDFIATHIGDLITENWQKEELNKMTCCFEESRKDLLVKNQAIESSINGIAIADLDGNITYVNNACMQMWGYNDKQEIIGNHVGKFWAEETILSCLQNIPENKGSI